MQDNRMSLVFEVFFLVNRSGVNQVVNNCWKVT